jgi:hypothetical protein
VNTYAQDDQIRPVITTVGNGNAVIAWNSNNQDGAGSGAYGQIIDPTGTKVGNEFRINTYITSDQTLGGLASLSNNKGFVAVWDSGAPTTAAGQDGSYMGIYGQLFDLSANKTGVEFQVNAYTANNQNSPKVTVLTNGNFVVTWDSDGQDGSSFGIYGQLYLTTLDGNSKPTKVGSEFLINTYTTGFQAFPHITSLTNGNFIVTWTSMSQDSSGYGAYAQIFNISGSKVGTEFLVNTYVAGDQNPLTVTSLNSGGFVIVWNSAGQDGSGVGVYGQVFNSSGTKIGSEFRVNTYVVTDQIDPKAVTLSNGNFVITWTSQGQDGFGYGIYGQMFNANGSKLGNEFSDQYLFGQ